MNAVFVWVISVENNGREPSAAVFLGYFQKMRDDLNISLFPTAGRNPSMRV